MFEICRVRICLQKDDKKFCYKTMFLKIFYTILWYKIMRPVAIAFDRPMIREHPMGSVWMKTTETCSH